MGIKRSELTQLQKRIAEEVPGFELREKRDSKLLWVGYYGLLMFLWQKDFMVSFWTTLGKIVYTPFLGDFGKDVAGDFATLWHERRHLLDLQWLEKKLTKPVAGVLWGFGYAMPQIFALGALGAIWGSWWWLLCVAFLAPLPAPFRTFIELRGYKASIEAWYKMTGKLPNPDDEWLMRMVNETFCGMKYYKMSWRPKAIHAWFLEAIEDLRAGNGELVPGPPPN